MALEIIEIEEKIISLRGQWVLLDSVVAEFYGVETRQINQAIKRNEDKFPKGYILQLTSEEWDGMKSQNVISKKGGKVKLPNAFTEKGLYMLATILKSKHATQTTLTIIETFAKVKELGRTLRQLPTATETEKQRLMKKAGKISVGILENDLVTTDKETTIELNLMGTLKIKHTIKKSRP